MRSRFCVHSGFSIPKSQNMVGLDIHELLKPVVPNISRSSITSCATPATSGLSVAARRARQIRRSVGRRPRRAIAENPISAAMMTSDLWSLDALSNCSSAHEGSSKYAELVSASATTSADAADKSISSWERVAGSGSLYPAGLSSRRRAAYGMNLRFPVR